MARKSEPTPSFVLMLQMPRTMLQFLHHKWFKMHVIMIQVSHACIITLLTHTEPDTEYTRSRVNVGRWRLAGSGGTYPTYTCSLLPHMIQLTISTAGEHQINILDAKLYEKKVRDN